uniref:Uncharacterized protein n=1 Tax=Romanomermis culicivorax TaxID=13658 RepID=A0A915K5V1_ROMCU
MDIISYKISLTRPKRESRFSQQHNALCYAPDRKNASIMLPNSFDITSSSSSSSSRLIKTGILHNVQLILLDRADDNFFTSVSKSLVKPKHTDI